MRLLTIATIFLNSFLLFLVQPLIAKRLLPIFGGSPLVWNTCLLFFQFVLLLGYLWAHLSFKWFGKKQPLAHGVVVLAAIAMLPIHLPEGLRTVYQNALRTDPHSFTAQPTVMLLAMLLGSVGLPFFALAGGAPIIQRWFSHSDDPKAHNPYFLYQASNLASMIALVGYPAWFERANGLVRQSELWTLGYAVFVAFIGLALYKALLPTKADANEIPAQLDAPPSWKRRLLWILLSAGPSALLLAVTTYVTTNIAPIPLIWVLPLAIYLLTFVYAFGTHKPIVFSVTRYLAIAVIFAPIFMMGEEPNWPILPTILAHLGGFTFLALATHCELGRQRPAATHLTDFYLCISIGGVVGGLFASIIAPLSFVTLAEYPIAIAVCFIAIGIAARPKRAWVGDLLIPPIAVFLVIWADNALTKPGTMYVWAILLGAGFIFTAPRAIRFAAFLATFLFALNNLVPVQPRLDAARSFFGVHYVLDLSESSRHALMNGSIEHGEQFVAHPQVATTYYSKHSGVGRAILQRQKEGRLQSYAVVGLGAGTLASYGLAGERLDYYEIDPDIERIARDRKLFTYVSNCRASLRVLIGDARLRLQEAPAGSYDLLALDAFTSDSIPVHLLTKEAFQLYVHALKPDGLLLVHVSNRYLRLAPVVAAISNDLGLDCLVCSVTKEEPYQAASSWIAVGRRDAVQPFATSAAWKPIELNPGIKAWTDDYSNVLSALIL